MTTWDWSLIISINNNLGCGCIGPTNNAPLQYGGRSTSPGATQTDSLNNSKLAILPACYGLCVILFHVLHLVPIGFTRPDLCCISKSTMKHLQKSDCKLDLPWQSACLLTHYSWIHRSSQLCSLLSVDQLLIFEHVVQSLLNMCLYNVCSLILTEPHTDQI